MSVGCIISIHSAIVLVRASSYHSLTNFKSWAVDTHFKFNHGGKIIVDVVREEEDTFPKVQECEECVKTMYSTDLLKSIEEVNWMGLENLDVRPNIVTLVV